MREHVAERRRRAADGPHRGGRRGVFREECGRHTGLHTLGRRRRYVVEVHQGVLAHGQLPDDLIVLGVKGSLQQPPELHVSLHRRHRRRRTRDRELGAGGRLLLRNRIGRRPRGRARPRQGWQRVELLVRCVARRCGRASVDGARRGRLRRRGAGRAGRRALLEQRELPPPCLEAVRLPELIC